MAGKLASNNLSQAIANTTKYSPDSAEIVLQGMQAQGMKDRAKTKNEAQRDYYKITDDATQQGYADLEKATEKAEGQKRMAGGLALIGATAYGYGDYMWNKNNPPPKPVMRQTADGSKYADAMDATQEKLKELKDQLSDLTGGNGGVQSYEEIRKGLDGKSESTKPESALSFRTPDSSDSTVSPASGTSVSTEFKPWTPLSSTIALAEGTLKDGKIQYGTFYGGSKFTNFDKHPDIVHHTKYGSSAAAGGYQFMPETYARTARELGLTDFSPASQEAAARQLTKWRKVDPDAEITTVSQFANTLHKLSPEWAGLPNLDGVSHYKGLNGNRAMNFERLRKHYEKVSGRTLLDD